MAEHLDQILSNFNKSIRLLSNEISGDLKVWTSFSMTISLFPKLFLHRLILLLIPTPAGLPAFCPSGVAFPEERPACRRPSGGGWCIFDERVLGTLWRAVATAGQWASLRFPAGRHRHCCSFCRWAGESGLEFQSGEQTKRQSYIKAKTQDGPDWCLMHISSS